MEGANRLTYRRVFGDSTKGIAKEDPDNISILISTLIPLHMIPRLNYAQVIIKSSMLSLWCRLADLRVSNLLPLP